MDPASVGKKIKENSPDGVASDGRRYVDIPDAELGTKFLLKHGDKGLMALGISKEEAEKSGKVELKGTSATDVDFLRNIISSSQEAVGKYQPEYTGLLDAIKGTGRVLTNKPGAQSEAEFRSAIADIRTAVRNLISGAAISDTEAKEFENLIPKLSDSDTAIRAKLKTLQERSIKKVGNTLATAGYEVDPAEYLKTQVQELPQPSEQGRPQESGSSLMRLLAGVQSGVASPITPAVAGIGGAIGGGPVGAFGGALLGTRLSRAAQQRGQGESLLTSLIPNPKEAGQELAGAATTALLDKGLGKVAGKLPGPMTLLRPGKKVAQLEREGIEEATQQYIGGSKLIAGLKRIKNDPGTGLATKRSIKKLLPEFEEGYKGTNVDLKRVKNLFIESNPRTASGIKKSTTQANFDAALRRTIRSESDKIGANKLIKSIEEASKAGKRTEFLQKYGKKAAGGAAFTAGGGLLAKALGLFPRVP